MADGDKITIEQINWDDSNLPKWATEATQERIAKHIGAMKKTDDKVAKDSKEQTKALKDVVKRVEELNKNSSENSKKMIANLQKKGGDYTKDLVKKNVQTPFKSVNLAIQKFAGKLGIAGAVIGGFAAAVGFVIGRLKQFSDSFRQVFAMGFRMEQGSLGLAKAAVAAEMGIAQYTELLGKFSTSVGIIGTKAFSDLNVQIRDNLQAQGMLGMSLAELAEYTGDFMDQLRTASMLGGKSNDELEEMVVRYAQNITAFSQLANVSRDQIAAVIKGSTAIEAFTNRLNVLPAMVQARVLRAAQTVTGMFAGLGTEFGDQLATTFTTAYGRGGLFFTEAGRELLAVNRRLYNSMSSLIDNLDSLDDQGAARATSELITEIANTSEAERERLGLIERSNTQFSGAARQQIQLINQVQEIQKKGALEQYKDLQRLRQESQIDKLSKAFINFERVTAKLSVAFNKFFTELFGNDRILGAISGAMERITAMGIDLAQKLVDNAGSIANKIANLVQRFMDFIGGFQGLSLGESIARALGSVFSVLQDAITGAIIKGFKLVLPSLFGGDSAIKDAEETRTAAVNNAVALKQAIETGDTSALTSSALPGLSKAQNKNNTTRTTAFSNILTSGLDPSSASTVGDMIQNAYDSLSKSDRNKPGALRDAVLAGIKGLDIDTRNAVLTKLLDMQNKNIAKQEEIINLAAGSNVNLQSSQVNLNSSGGATGTGGTDNAVGTDMSDPAGLSAAKMRIMKQYLPMTGSSDPTATAEGEYYTTSLALLRNIASNTGKGASASKETANSLN
tara:strand:- start:28853 stop:31228 length:2376 start_codon:yes stop_codon:yes gene_type:complete